MVPSSPSKDIAENVMDQLIGDIICPASMFDAEAQGIIDDPFFCCAATHLC
jgi:hypothetical protein